MAWLFGPKSGAFQTQTPGSWLMAWMLAFVVGLPVLVILLAVLGAAHRYAPRLRIIPLVGVKIPGAGQ